jgi:uncharacterized protein YycO
MRQRKNPAQPLKNRIVKWIGKTVIVIFLVICFINFLNWLTEADGAWKPDYSKADLSSIVSKEELTNEDYQTIFAQTGLGRDAADELLQKKAGNNRVKVFEQYQNNFFASGSYECSVVAVIVHEERMKNKDGKLVVGFEIPDLRNGDILITKATHSLGWRHGHAAIVTDAAKGETLEAILLGNPSLLQNVSKWRNFPSFIHLRLKDHENVDTDKIAVYAKNEILGVPYGLLTGIPVKAPDNIKKTQCAHLVWYPYEHFGYDLDSDGSWLVTPKDIANSNLLEVVQVYGVNPEEIWP